MRQCEQIAGAFTVEETNELAILLRAGELPRRLVGIEERAPETYNKFSLCQEVLSITQLLQSSYSRHSFRRFSSLAPESGLVWCLRTLWV